MLTYQAIEYCGFMMRVLTDLEKSFSPLLDFGRKFGSLERKVSLEILSTSDIQVNATFTNYSLSSKQNFIIKSNELIDIFIKDFDFVGFIKNNHIIDNKIIEYKKLNAITDKNSFGLIKSIDRVSDCLEDFLRIRGRTQSTRLGQSAGYFANLFDKSISHYCDILALIENFDSEIEKDDDKAVLEVQLLQVDLGFEEFILILNAIKTIYEQICIIAKNENANMEIVKIESGSLLSKLLGDDNIVKVVVQLIKRVVDLCFSHFTKEGKLLTHSNIMKILGEENELIAALEANGINVDEAKENMTESIGLISKNLLLIARSGSPKVKINSEVIDLPSALQQNYIETAQKKQLCAMEEE